MRRFDKVHAQAARSLPKPQLEPHAALARTRLLDELRCAADEHLLHARVAESAAVRNALGVENDASANFGWKARVPLANGRFDRTEVDMRLGSLLVEAKLTEVGFQTRAASIVEAYRDFDAVFDRDLLPRVEIATARWMQASEFPENTSQEFESVIADPDSFVRHRHQLSPARRSRLRKLSADPQRAGCARRGLQLLRHPRRAPA